MADYLDQIEDESIFIIREAYKKIKNLALLWSMGKDSTVLLHLVKKAFLGNVPIPLVHIDTSYKIPEMIEWRDSFVKKHNLRLIVGMNKEALANGMGPAQGRLTCCGALKTQALLNVTSEQEIQGLLVGIRRDEEGSRAKERVVSPRSASSTWTYKEQPAEVWHYYNLHVPTNIHLRIHPLLHWTELNVWEYIRRENLQVMPLYFAKDGKRYRSLGCWPCTGTIESEAQNIDDIISELKITRVGERAGRAQDQADSHAMQKLRKDGYM
ncbi:MAG: sulfate adenylyltransferase subunit 2 [Candidatus Obscuribacterales bacterium]|nr:sulfate adenylyltransferase subunit 2 [Candidatus Obscuribacterales bacterium]